MHGYSNQLGVQCSYCHAQSTTGSGLDYSSDAKPEKTTARYMMTMADDINEKYISKSLPVGAAAQVTCGTCHRGHAKPEAFAMQPRGHEGH
jgi:hypothetical protein